MTKLAVIYQEWNEPTCHYYKPVLEALVKNDINTDESLLEQDLDFLCNKIKISKQIIRAFIKQVILSTLLEEKSLSAPSSVTTAEINTMNNMTNISKKYLSTGFESLDKLLHDGKGMQFRQIIEICGEQGFNKIKFTTHIMASFLLSSYSQDDVHVFDASGMFEPRRMSGTFINKNIDPAILTQFECTQLFGSAHLVQSLENLRVVLAANSRSNTLVPSFILLDDISSLIGNDWSKPIITEIVNKLKLLAKLNCLVIILHHTSSKYELSAGQNQYEARWNPMIDLRLYLTEESDNLNQVEILKSRMEQQQQQEKPTLRSIYMD